MTRFLSVLILSLIYCSAAPKVLAAELDVVIAYLKRQVEEPARISKLSVPPIDRGREGARLGLSDNATTGQFLKHQYRLIEQTVAPDEDWLVAAKEVAIKSDFLVVQAPASDLMALADASWATDKIIFNIADEEDLLRNDQCRANVFHTAASHSMRADALMQVLSAKRWSPVLLVEGPTEQDGLFANALRRAAFKFKIKIADEIKFEYNADIRRSASQEVPLLTQSEYQVVVIADSAHDFGQYFMYNTWLPRPVAGDHGMMVVGFSQAMEQWGALQLQSRFEKQAKRPITSIDYWAWAAVRSIGEAITRTQSDKVEDVRNYLISDDFELAGFKGRPLSYRQWNGQLRQPLGIVHTYATVAMPPLEVFLHQHNVLDTLGFDEPESTCTHFTQED